MGWLTHLKQIGHQMINWPKPPSPIQRIPFSVFTPDRDDWKLGKSEADRMEIAWIERDYEDWLFCQGIERSNQPKAHQELFPGL